MTFLGPSGSGKTTTLMMLAGFEHPTSGSILLRGVEADRIPPQKRNIGMVFQNYALFPHMSVGENIGYPLRVRGVSKTEIAEKVRSVLDTVRLPDIADRKPAQLSGGQQQRVALARALVFNPTIVLMDEPLGALDKRLREEMQIEIRALQRRLGLTVVYVTHDQSEALTMSDRVAVFDHGKITQLASPSGIYEQPENAFVAGFVGDTNFLEGVGIEEGQDAWRIQLDCGPVITIGADERLTEGVRLTVAVRPERVRILPSPTEQPASIPAKIVEVVYLGDQLRVDLEMQGGKVIYAKIPNIRESDKYIVGKSVSVSWERDDARIFLR